MQISGFTSHLAVSFRRLPGTPHPRLQTLLSAISTGMRLSPVTVTVVPADTQEPGSALVATSCRFSYFSGDGHILEDELVADTAIARMCSTTFEAVWDR